MGLAFNDTTKQFTDTANTARPELYPGFVLASRKVRPELAASMLALVAAKVAPRHWRLVGEDTPSKPLLVERLLEADAAIVDQVIQDSKAEAVARAGDARAALEGALVELRAADPKAFSPEGRALLALVDLGFIR